MRKTAVHFGAGSIGRGFLGQLYHESGYHTVFIDVEKEVVTALNARRSYPIDIVSEEETERVMVRNVSAVNGRDTEAAATALADADIASTAVGVNALPHIAPVIARAIVRRFAEHDAPALDIILCENVKNGAAYMRKLVAEQLPQAYHARLDDSVGFVEASIGRMVPVMSADQKTSDPLLVCVEPYCELPVDAAGFKGPVPAIAYMEPTQHFAAYVERKLFVHNLTHATTAYLGYRQGYTYIYEAIRDPMVRRVVEGAGRESCAALTRKHGLDADALIAHVEDLVSRYHNTALADQIARVGRDPVRKLGRDDRLIGAARLCVAQGIEPRHIATATAAALLFDVPDDPTAGQVQSLLADGGVAAVLREICEIEPETPLGMLISKAYGELQNSKG